MSQTPTDEEKWRLALLAETGSAFSPLDRVRATMECVHLTQLRVPANAREAAAKKEAMRFIMGDCLCADERTSSD